MVPFGRVGFLAVALAVTTGCATLVGSKMESLNVVSYPPGAEVRVNGATRGVTPIVVDFDRKHAPTVEVGGVQSCRLGMSAGTGYVVADVVLAVLLFPIGCLSFIDADGAWNTLDFDTCTVNLQSTLPLDAPALVGADNRNQLPRPASEEASRPPQSLPPVLGVSSFREATPEECAAAGTNHGRIVAAIVKGSPAWKADILPGDLMMSINQASVDDDGDVATANTSFRDLLSKLAGKTVPIVLRRRGEEITKMVRLNILAAPVEPLEPRQPKAPDDSVIPRKPVPHNNSGSKCNQDSDCAPGLTCHPQVKVCHDASR